MYLPSRTMESNAQPVSRLSMNSTDPNTVAGAPVRQRALMAVVLTP